METVFKYLQFFDLGEQASGRLEMLIEGVRKFNERFNHSYPTRVTASRYIDWLDMQTKGGVMPRKHEDDSPWSGGFASNH